MKRFTREVEAHFRSFFMVLEGSVALDRIGELPPEDLPSRRTVSGGWRIAR